ncbi:MAG TPA: GNAT family N-acetyltransferase [Pyrinomonadaceae bacterium]|nr:GNAT family N-acetyltransferase [Pyrinomonadaceae bacterium]
MEIRRISAEEAQPMRAAILRPGLPFEASVYRLDDDAESLHVGAFEDGRLVTVATILHEPPPGEEQPRAWRLRGMVTLPEMQRRGYGRAVLLHCIAQLAGRGATLLWCNARSDAVEFYRGLRFETEGGEQKTERGTSFIRMKRVVTYRDAQAELEQPT